MPDTGLNIVTGACRTGGEYKLQPVFAEDLAELAVNAAQSLSTGNQPVFQGVSFQVAEAVMLPDAARWGLDWSGITNWTPPRLWRRTKRYTSKPSM